MPRDKLSTLKVEKARPGKKIKVLSDGDGLRLLVHPNGGRYWQLRFTIGGRESSMQLGHYPDIALGEARKLRDQAKSDLRGGHSPVIRRRIRKAEQQQAEAQTFDSVADMWLSHGQSHPNRRTGRVWSLTHIQRNESLLKNYLLPALKDMPIQVITEGLLRTAVERAYEKGRRESARRAAAVASQVFTFAKERNLYQGHNPAAELLAYSTLAKPEVKHFAALRKDQVGEMLRKLNSSGFLPVTQAALLLMLYTGLRDLSVRGATWSEIDLDKGMWTIPGERMKRGKEHRVPLPRQATHTLEQLKALTFKGRKSYIFASEASKYGILAENSLRLALHRMGFKVTAHGLRSLMTDVLNEYGFNPDAIERQLDHTERNQVRAAYLRSDFMEQRAPIMQWWADWCDSRMRQEEAPALPDQLIRSPRAA